MSSTELANAIARFSAAADLEPLRAEALAAFAELRVQLNRGQARAAVPLAGGWRTEVWVKQGILLGFRLGALREHPSPAPFSFLDKATLPTRAFAAADQVRVVPGGTTVRDGAYLAPGVILMPPAFVNIGAYVDEGTLIDSHALVGSCAQLGKRVHLSAAAQIGGVLEPVGATPVIIEDEALIGGNCGVYEGTRVGRGAVLAAGVVLTRSTPVYDLVRECIHRASSEIPLTIPPAAVVVPGARAVARGKGAEWGLSLATPVIVKYRDGKTDAATALEEWLR
ncbi:MAG TPA: 2,3,4,5-tetrahydropyridine-2,6-dicarboxylate N-succinyltransferase [Terriglobales bacterium]|nr:2,3,4,5-tetrahydropyridine-2,6-dicarboxylate N-succinyltransferase [Terriglobales bacterium]